MKIYNNSKPDTNIENSSGVVCIGGFDGIHLAHQQLFKKTISISTEFDIITFEVIPKIYFNEDRVTFAFDHFLVLISQNHFLFPWNFI